MTRGGIESGTSNRRGRYAPSPTGQLHLGNLRTAMVAWLHARLHNYEFILRVEDLDSARCRSEFSEQMVQDLRWFGMDWEVGPGLGQPLPDYVQSQRLEIYAGYLERLFEQDLIYPCDCSRKFLATQPESRSGKLGLVYPGNCRSRRLGQLPDITRAKPQLFSLRMRCGETEAGFQDAVYADQRADLANEIGDFVVYRRDAVIAYHLAVVVDDIEMGITDVVRGADLLDSVFPQQVIYQALDAAQPRYVHVPLLQDEGGQKLSKSRQAISVRSLIEQNVSAEGLVGQLAYSIGLTERDEALSLQELCASLDTTRLISAIKKCL